MGLQVDAMVCSHGHCDSTIFFIIDIQPDREGISTTAYHVVDKFDSNVPSGGGDKSGGAAKVCKTFAQVHSLIDVLEMEEVGVEHLLRDINDPPVSIATNLVKAKPSGLLMLTGKMVEMKDYLTAVLEDRMKANAVIIANMQAIVNFLPNLNGKICAKYVGEEQ